MDACLPGRAGQYRRAAQSSSSGLIKKCNYYFEKWAARIRSKPRVAATGLQRLAIYNRESFFLFNLNPTVPAISLCQIRNFLLLFQAKAPQTKTGGQLCISTKITERGGPEVFFFSINIFFMKGYY